MNREEQFVHSTDSPTADPAPRLAPHPRSGVLVLAAACPRLGTPMDGGWSRPAPAQPDQEGGRDARGR